MIKRRLSLWRLVAATLTILLLGSIPVVLANASELADMLPKGDLSEKGICPNGYVALTFDDGPDPVTTPRIMEELRDGGARGTFFVIGAKAEAHPELIHQLDRDGMTIGNHTYDHPFLDQAPSDVVRNEITHTTQILKDEGVTPTLFRPPYGRTNPSVTATAQSLGLTEALWTYDSDDYDNVTTQQLLTAAGKTRNGDVLLLHDGHQSTVDALPQVLANLTQRGLCSGQVVPSALPQQAWVEYDGPDRTYYNATTARW